MKKIFLLCALVLMSSSIASAEDVCVATDNCILFRVIGETNGIVTQFVYNVDTLKPIMNGLIVSHQIIKVKRGSSLYVLARRENYIQVFYNGSVYYTIDIAVRCY